MRFERAKESILGCCLSYLEQFLAEVKLVCHLLHCTAQQAHAHAWHLAQLRGLTLYHLALLSQDEYMDLMHEKEQNSQL